MALYQLSCFIKRAVLDWMTKSKGIHKLLTDITTLIKCESLCSAYTNYTIVYSDQLSAPRKIAISSLTEEAQNERLGYKCSRAL